MEGAGESNRSRARSSRPRPPPSAKDRNEGLGRWSERQNGPHAATLGFDAGCPVHPWDGLREGPGHRPMGTGNFSRGTQGRAPSRRRPLRGRPRQPRFQLVETAPGESTTAVAHELASEPDVILAEPDSVNDTASIPDDRLFGQLWGLLNTGAGVHWQTATPGADVNASGAWLRTVGDPSVVVADLDSGYRFEHPDLAPVTWTNPGEIPGNGIDDDHDGIVDDVHGADFIGSNGQVPSIDGDPTDDDLITGGHGVHTAGTIGAAGNNGIGVTGVAQNVRLMPLRVCSRFPGSEDNRCLASGRGRRRQLRRRQGRPHRKHVVQRHRREPGPGQRDGSRHPHAVRHRGRQRPQRQRQRPRPDDRRTEPRGPLSLRFHASEPGLSARPRRDRQRHLRGGHRPERCPGPLLGLGQGIGRPRRAWNRHPQHLPVPRLVRRRLRAQLRVELGRDRPERRLRTDERSAVRLLRHHRQDRPTVAQYDPREHLTHVLDPAQRRLQVQPVRSGRSVLR